MLDRMPIGRTLVRFHALTKYLKMTNPWGGGDTTPQKPAMDAQTAAHEGVRLGLFASQRAAHISDFDPHVQQIFRED